VQAGFLALHGEVEVGELDAVGGALDMGEVHLVGQRQDPEPVGVHGGFAAGELHHPAVHRALVAQRLQHLLDLLERGLVDVVLDVGVGEADGTGQVAAVGQVHVGQDGVADMKVAHAAIVGTGGGFSHRRIGNTLTDIVVPRQGLPVDIHVGKDQIAAVAVVGTRFFHVHLAVLLEEPGVDLPAALRAQRDGRVRQVPWQRCDFSAAQGLAGGSGFFFSGFGFHNGRSMRSENAPPALRRRR